MRFIIHHSIPSSAENYLQECGCAGIVYLVSCYATLFMYCFVVVVLYFICNSNSTFILGRDGLPSFCFLYYAKRDVESVKNLIINGPGNLPVMRARLTNFNKFNDTIKSTNKCRRQSILLLLDEVRSNKCSIAESNCDNCTKDHVFGHVDVSNEVQLFVEKLPTIHALNSLLMVQASQNLCQQAVKRELCHTFFGIFSHWPSWAIHDFIDYLLLEEVLEKVFLLSFSFLLNVGIAIALYPIRIDLLRQEESSTTEEEKKKGHRCPSRCPSLSSSSSSCLLMQFHFLFYDNSCCFLYFISDY